MAKDFTFFKSSVEECKAMAAFIAELERQGIEYNVEHDNYKFFVRITGC